MTCLSKDEAGAVLILVSALRYYGVDVARLFNRNTDRDEQTTRA
ncbi:MAG: hypothetical protein AAF787_03625 [Chloroflexota bacterium]